MRYVHLTKALALAAVMAFAAGCSSTGSKTDSGAMSGTGTGTDTSAYGAGTGTGVTPGSWEEVATLKNVFYFEFDRAVVRQEFFPDLEGHARYLAGNPSARVRLDGHTDERGTREYNMALGERRANAVERLLIVNGANAGQIETVSYGEERPSVTGNHEGAWSQNRRVELRYLSR
ncbi:peptidoglycan-associated lipoprotein Pal [Nitrincola iocasae]|jgi:peptidoglycan-associated lipoprotein|uniref:Peptidoglycan-associated lipoprotein n=1 Tax=Nitrincola iocasae TaxID=2614693 RepID=A0A5J6LEX2_9GAMM|nr:peptidoglycan-associated lipoprotein Pal [Nitrincola iocasae]QEW07184.1 peptidoglycan-associated lipoprotein Pal [Nitrincola iocasae]